MADDPPNGFLHSLRINWALIAAVGIFIMQWTDMRTQLAGTQAQIVKLQNDLNTIRPTVHMLTKIEADLNSHELIGAHLQAEQRINALSERQSVSETKFEALLERLNKFLDREAL